MSLTHFLKALRETGEVPVSTSRDLFPEDDAPSLRVLRDWDSEARLSLGHEPPPFAAGPALWAARLLYRGCRALVDRATDTSTLQRHLAAPCPASPSPSVAYSADLALRYLPDLFRLSKGLSEDDPLNASLLRLAREWPLSSVGIPGVGEVDPALILDDRCLRLLYVDRILASRDLSRAGDPRVREALLEALGAFGPQLAPSFGAVLPPQEQAP
ncbi:MAG: hypothetical protein HYY93_13610 [Planctomycetes bacterium]|nr:hypothetical protein [Planctomycetota bacterium]